MKFADTGASYHVTAEQSNLLQHSDANHGPEQLFVGNGKGVSILNTGSSFLFDKSKNGTKEMLLKGRTSGGLYYFDNLTVPKSGSPAHTTVSNSSPLPTSVSSD
ncbi:hypothetical protein PIB30_003305 [Stylosanthes scabra]|uniref:Uncharacterized protein n=1 Tax=Stylosanthes scabra TaxID=79078 RepID=A0ABU6S3L1_9FABA|nr:hypothetical protein [Stylosanthes scabra]